MINSATIIVLLYLYHSHRLLIHWCRLPTNSNIFYNDLHCHLIFLIIIIIASFIISFIPAFSPFPQQLSIFSPILFDSNLYNSFLFFFNLCCSYRGNSFLAVSLSRLNSTNDRTSLQGVKLAKNYRRMGRMLCVVRKSEAKSKYTPVGTA